MFSRPAPMNQNYLISIRESFYKITNSRNLIYNDKMLNEGSEMCWKFAGNFMIRINGDVV